MRVGTFYGHIGRNAEVRYTPNGTAVANFPLGVKARRNQQEHTLWVDCAIFGNRAQSNLVNFLVAGQGVVVSGEQDIRVFQKRDQSWGAAIELQVDKISLAGAAPNGGQGGAQPQGGQPQNQGQPMNQGQPQGQPMNQGPQNQGQPANGGHAPAPVDDFDDDIPF